MASSAKATRPTDQIVFAHNSERQFARLLDFYRVDWEYEPTAFPIEWDSAGNPVQSFRPDFYLPGEAPAAGAATPDAGVVADPPVAEAAGGVPPRAAPQGTQG